MTSASSTVPAAAVPAAPAAGVDEALRHRLRLLVCCLGLAVLAFATRPGRLLADTKIDMAVNPVGFLARALHLWDPAQYGQLQNQAVGYFFPMGPFFVAGRAVGLEPWVVQRLWLTLLMCVAFLGVERLAGRLGVGTPLTRLLAGFGYALAPRGLALLGVVSSEFLPAAMLPWILLPLVAGVRDGRYGRAAARSAVAVALCGGINATATLGAAAMAVVYVASRPRGTPRLRLLAWWGAAVAAATLWWTVPLLLLSRYGFSFLAYTESAEVTTDPTGVVNALRGASNWVAYYVVDGAPWYPLGFTFAASAFGIAVSVVLAALGLVGLCDRRMRARAFLLVSLLLGVAIISVGHGGVLAGPLAEPLRDLLNGPLAPLRNVHKFDPMIRLPIALGLAHLLAVLPRPSPRRAVSAIALGGLAGMVTPALAHGLSGTGDFTQVPPYWRDATGWLNRHAGDQMVLAVPGSKFGEYLWGRPLDEVMQPLLSVPWATRRVAASGSIGLTRLLEAVDRRLAAGQGSPGLSEVLGRVGVRYLLVRNDLDREQLRGVWPARVHEALAGSPGLRKVAEFGPEVGHRLLEDAVETFDQPYPALEVYEVGGAEPAATLVGAQRPLRVQGGPEALLTMADNGVLRGRPVLLNDDDGGVPSAQPVMTDSLRLVDRNLGEIWKTASATLTPADRPRGVGIARDLDEPGWTRHQTVAEYRGVARISASSSTADVDAVPQLRSPGHHPYAAMDGDYRTTWESGGWEGPVGQWIRIDFEGLTDPRSLAVAFARNPFLGPRVTRVAVETERGRIDQDVRATGDPEPLRAPPGASGWLRIRILKLASEPRNPVGTRVAITEIIVNDVRARQTYRLPAPAGDAANQPAAVVMGRSGDGKADCMRGSLRWVCSAVLGEVDEEGYGFDRTFSSAVARSAVVSGTAVLTDLDRIRLYSQTGPAEPRVSGSTSWVDHPVSQPRSAFDGDPATSWIPDPGDRAPTLAVSLPRPVKVDEIAVERPAGASGPVHVTVQTGRGEVRGGWLDDTDAVSFQPVRTDHLTLTFTTPQPKLQISEVRIARVRTLAGAYSRHPVKLPCGLGPRLTVNGELVDTTATGTVADLVKGSRLRFTACERVDVAVGDNQVQAPRDGGFRVESVVIDNAGAASLAGAPRRPGTPVDVTQWTTTSRKLLVAADEVSYLVLNENHNDGWVATLQGVRLRQVRLDGWRQGYLVPAGSYGTVVLSYRPDVVHRGAVLAGLGFLLLVVLAAGWPWRRSPALAPAPRAAPPAGPGGRPASPGAAAPAAGIRTPRALIVIGTVTGFWVAGVAGAAVVALTVALALGRLGPRGPRVRRLAVSAWTPGVVLLAGGVAAIAGGALSPDPVALERVLLSDAAPQAAGLVAVGLLLARFVVPVRSGVAAAPSPRPPVPVPAAAPPASRDEHLDGAGR